MNNINVKHLIPNTVRSWLTILLLAPIVYLLYYCLVFGSLVKVYRGQLFGVAPYSSYSKSTLSRSLKVRVYYPRHLASFGYRWIYITIYNSGSKPVEHVKVWFSATPDERVGENISPNNVVIFPSLYGGKNYIDKSVEFAEIPAKGVVSGRLPVIAPWGQVVTGALYIDEANVAGNKDAHSSPSVLLKLDKSKWDVNVIQSWSHGLIEFGLLPPWANAFLILAILIITGLQDSREPDERVLCLKEKYLSLLRVMIRVAGSMAVVVLFVWFFLFLPFGIKTLWGLPVASLVVGTVCWFLHRKVSNRFLAVYRSNNHREIAFLEGDHGHS